MDTTIKSEVEPKVIIIVTTTNKQKLEPIKNVFMSIFPEKGKPKVVGFRTNTGVPDGQPYGMSGTNQAVSQRIKDYEEIICNPNFDKNAKQYIENASYIVSIENGIQSLEDNNGSTYIDFPIVQIIDVKTKKSIKCFGQGRPIPLNVLRNLKKKGVNEEGRGKFIEDYYRNLGLTFSREDIIKNTLITAFEQIKNSSNIENLLSKESIENYIKKYKTASS